jgi:hypothetical protein
VTDKWASVSGLIRILYRNLTEAAEENHETSPVCIDGVPTDNEIRTKNLPTVYVQRML